MGRDHQEETGGTPTEGTQEGTQAETSETRSSSEGTSMKKPETIDIALLLAVLALLVMLATGTWQQAITHELGELRDPPAHHELIDHDEADEPEHDENHRLHRLGKRQAGNAPP